jgi:predicted ATP-dependent serine protease
LLLSVTTPVSAQDAASRPLVPPQEAPVTLVGVSTTVPVQGLTAEKLSAVRTALEGLTRTVWVCAECSATQAEQGACEACEQEDAELVEQQQALLGDVALDPDKGAVGFSPAAGASVKLSEIEATLAKEQVSVQADRLSISPATTLLVAGVTSEDALEELDSALEDCQLFRSVESTFKPGKLAEVAVVSSTPAPTRLAVSETIARAGIGLRLADLAWSGEPGKG